MRIAVIAPGSRGDVQPYIALGKGLRDAGHDVRLLTHENFASLVEAHQLEFWPLRGNVQEVAESQEMRELLEKGNFLAIAAFQADAAKHAALEWAEDGMAACTGMDVILAGIGGLYIGISLAEKLKIPLIQAHSIPFTPTKSFPGALFPQTDLRLASVNYLSHQITRQIMWQGFRVADKVVRQAVLGLPSAPFLGPYRSSALESMPVLYGFSPSVIPQPNDWDTDKKITGYWFLDEEDAWQPSSDLVDFLSSGSAPIYIGFGSMSSRNPEETAELVINAVRLSKQRAILLSGWGGLRSNDLPDSVFLLRAVPHAWLFPRVAAVVHHGGAGTTAAGLRAGVPTTIIPFFGDQPFWGARVAELGVGPKPIPRKTLTSENLAQALQETVTHEAMRQRASNLGSRIRAEDGVASAVEIIQRIRI
jgi:UDP:flavonoid glycosyltransferase YjiC (YdhE family)